LDGTTLSEGLAPLAGVFVLPVPAVFLLVALAAVLGAVFLVLKIKPPSNNHYFSSYYTSFPGG